MVTTAYTCIYVYMASRLRLRSQPSGGARRLRQIILPSFLSYCPRPSLSPPFDLRIFPVSCALEREGVDSRLGEGPEKRPDFHCCEYMYNYVNLHNFEIVPHKLQFAQLINCTKHHAICKLPTHGASDNRQNKARHLCAESNA